MSARLRAVEARRRVSSDEGRTPPVAAAGPAKFATPVATNVIDRPRVFGRFDGRPDLGTVLVAAPAGWGKTLAVGSWIAAGADGCRAAWVSLDRTDDEERAFWRTVATALLGVADESERAALRQVASSDGDDLPGLVVAAVRQLQRPVVLVLDDLHEVRSPDLHAGLLRLIERPLPMLSLLILTRRDPPWPLDRLRLSGVLTDVRAADLAFRSDEAAALFAQLQLDLSAGQLERLIAGTDGWAAGLRLAALHLLGRDDVQAAVEHFSGDDHSVAGYLLAEVLNQQSPELVGFLQTISVVDLVCADLADALTGADDGAQRLADLAASHLFVQAVGWRGRWYVLHRLIVDLLRARPVSRRVRRDLHRRAAEWFRDHEMPLEAVRSALRGELWPLAAHLVGIHLAPLVLRGSARELELLLAEVPRAVLLGMPELATAMAGARAVQGVGTDLTVLVEAARTGAARLSQVRAERVGVFLDFITAGVARWAGDFDTAAIMFGRVPHEPAGLTRLGLDGVEILERLALSNRGTAELWSGNLIQAERHLLIAADPGAGAPTLPNINSAAHLALLHCEQGRLDTAATIAQEVAATATTHGWARTVQAVGAYLTMARVQLDRDELGEIDDWLRRVAEVEAVTPELHIQLAAALVLAAWRDATGDHERALAGLRQTSGQLAARTPPRGLAEQQILAEAALLARMGQRGQAGALLDAWGGAHTPLAAVTAARIHLLLGELTSAERALPDSTELDLRTRVGAALVGALAALRSGADETALDRVEDALRVAAPVALRRPFLTDAADLRDLLQRRVERGSAAAAFAVDLLQRMSGAPTDELAARRPLVDPLTDRELTVLRYLASTLSNAEIASELYVSVSTVKTHQRAVYRKLSAGGRRDAVRRARTLSLL